MEMKSSLVKKLASYSAFASAVMAVKESDAQIVYHDVNPDFVIPAGQDGTYYLDLNADGVNDFKFYVNGFFSGASVYVFSQGNQSSSYNYPEAMKGVPLYAGQLISPGNNWSSSLLLAYVSASSSVGQWINKTDRYLGLRIPVNNNYYYGWARLDVLANGNNFVIKDYAFQTQPNTPIAAGDKGCDSVQINPVVTELPDEELLSSVVNGNQWYMNGIAMPGQTNDTLLADPTGFYSTRVTDSAGCIVSSLAFDFIKCDSVSAVADMSADTTGNNICSGSSAFFYLEEVPHQNFQVQWYKNMQPVAGATSKNYYAGPITVSTSVYAIIQNAVTNCIDTTQTFALNVLPVPTIPVITQLYDTLSTDTSYYSYQWRKGYYPQNITGATDDFYKMTQNNYFSVKVTDSNGCSSSSANNYYGLCDYLQPAVTVDGYSYICDGDSVLLTTGLSPYCTYSWKRNNLSLNDFDTATYANQAGNYSCSVTDTLHGCSWYTSVVISVSQPGAPQIFLSGDSLISSPSTSYQWFVNGNDIAGATSQSFHPDSTGYYSVGITNLYGCFAMSDSFYFENIPTSVDGEVSGLTDEKWLGGFVQVFNVFGEEIFSGVVKSIPLQLNLENFPAGIYYAAIRKEKTFVVFRVLNTK